MRMTSMIFTSAARERAIITGTNRVVNALNSKILTMLHGEEFSLFSVTRLCSDDTRMQNLLSTEFLNSLRSPGVPEHELKLKLNCLCMVTRNISVQDRLMNNTKVIVREIGRHLVTVETLMEHRHFILPRIIFRFTLPRSGLMIERRQFPLRLCYAITVNKSQGQTLDRVCLDLREHPFAHGQLYVGASRVRSQSNILILTLDDHLHHSCALTKNIVYQDLLPS
jgi:ATP-dependent DNA helicase PIF1